MTSPNDDFRTRLREHADRLESHMHSLQEYLSKEAHTLSEKALEEVRSDLQVIKDLITKWRQ